MYGRCYNSTLETDKSCDSTISQPPRCSQQPYWLGQTYSNLLANLTRQFHMPYNVKLQVGILINTLFLKVSIQFVVNNKILKVSRNIFR